MRIHAEQIAYRPVEPPVMELPDWPGDLPQSVYQDRLARTLAVMRLENLDALILYADREHGANFGYLCGFEPRFEEGCLVLRHGGEASLLLGNENLKMAAYSRVPATGVHVPLFSLPNQPMDGHCDLKDAFKRAGIEAGMRCGVVGWKMFTTPGDNRRILDVPHFIVAALEEAAAGGSLENAAALLIDPMRGVRTVAGADEIAQFEYAATLASQCVYRVLGQLEPGKTERELAGLLSIDGMPLSCYSICATGDRFTNAVIYPRNKRVSVGDKFTTSMGLRGGLTCRAGYVANGQEDLDGAAKDWLDVVAKPYFAANATWYSTVGVGVTGAEVYDAVEAVFPKADYGWSLNPGHLIATEEWMSSPMCAGKNSVLRSGMILQMDIIPSVPGHAGVNAEDGVLLADEPLQAELGEKYPRMLARMLRRRDHLRSQLNIPMRDDVLPMSDTCGDLRPYLLNREWALVRI